MTSRPGPTTSLRAWTRGSLLLLAFLVSFGCRATRAPARLEPIATPTEPAQHEPDVEPTPAWVGEPLSWEKLKAIETWLATQPTEGASFWRVEGELQLAQGRLEFARRDLGAKGGDTAGATKRVKSSRAGLERVAQDAYATEGQKKRAQDLVARADKLLDGKSATNANSLASVPVIGRAIWGAAPARGERMEPTKGGYKRITVHHSAEENAPELDGSIADSAAALRLMQRSHMESKSPRWGDIGYHFLIDPAGHVFQGRDLAWQGAHADGDNNIQNIGVCMIGNFDEEKPTKAALDSLRKLLDGLRRTYSIPKLAVCGHQDLKSTRCPGRFLEPWVKTYAR
ncbi:MAG: N-acetylmuramoyl-L-alanine amidase [Planctomycetes bacterium]|nr:N-acetylmuramoyl-L-alanine amidase [Planctomycetota bacterium]